MTEVTEHASDIGPWSPDITSRDVQQYRLGLHSDKQKNSSDALKVITLFPFRMDKLHFFIFFTNRQQIKRLQLVGVFCCTLMVLTVDWD